MSPGTGPQTCSGSKNGCGPCTPNPHKWKQCVSQAINGLFHTSKSVTVSEASGQLTTTTTKGNFWNDLKGQTHNVLQDDGKYLPQLWPYNMTASVSGKPRIVEGFKASTEVKDSLELYEFDFVVPIRVSKVTSDAAGKCTIVGCNC
jgi:hypothetical protein